MVLQYAKTLIIFILLQFFAALAPAQTAASIIGKWKGEDKPNNHIAISLHPDGMYYGILVYEEGKTTNLGKKILNHLKYDAEKNIFKGTMSPPDANITLNITLSIVDNKKLKLTAKKLFLTKTLYFLRIP